MLTKGYLSVMVGISLLLTMVVVVLSVVLYTNGPRVRLVSFEKDVKVTTQHKNSAITITFDRPIVEQDYSEQIFFVPNVSFTAETSRQSIVVTLDQNLEHSTEYTLNVKADIADETGRTMKRDHVESFQVGAPRYAYIERNYDVDLNDDTVLLQDADDYLKLRGLNEEKEQILFAATEIGLFDINQNHAVVSARDDTFDRIFIIELDTLGVRELPLEVEGAIASIAVSPVGEVALFTVTPDFNSVDPEYYDQVANQITAVDLVTGKQTPLVNSADEPVRSFAPIQFDPNGQTALAKDDLNTFYAVSPFNDYDPILIGPNSISYGFSDDADEIVFRDGEDFLRYDVQAGEEEVFVFDSKDYVRDIDTAGSDVYYSSTTYINGQPRSYVERISGWQDDGVESVWSSQDGSDKSLRSFAVSSDGLLLALQISPIQCKFDTISVNRQCTTAETAVYDLDSSEEIADFRGFDLVWLP